jgi:hypothetical protein
MPIIQVGISHHKNLDGSVTEEPIFREFDDVKAEKIKQLNDEIDAYFEDVYPKHERELMASIAETYESVDMQEKRKHRDFIQSISEMKVDLFNKVDEADTISEMNSIRFNPTATLNRPKRLVLKRNKKVRQ